MHNIGTVKDIVDWRLCLGCGACAYVCPERKIRLVDFLEEGIRPSLRDTHCDACRTCLEVCPGFERDNTKINNRPGAIESLTPYCGPVLEVWEGHATDPQIRLAGSSGGLITAISAYCLEKEKMHGVLHIGQDPGDPLRNKTVMSRTRRELLDRTGSRYAPASACDRLDLIESAPGPCVFVGQPSEATALRKAQRLKPELGARVGLAISFFCAGSPARKGTTELLKSMGLELERVSDIRYRGNGWPGKFAVTLRGESSPSHFRSYKESWSFVQAYRPFSTHLCPDGTGEDADISCGDPWYREVQEGEPGSSLVVVRTETGRRMVRAAIEAGYVELRPAEPWKLLRSQEGLFEKRGAIWGRVLLLRLLGLPAPRLKGYSLFKNWWRLSLEDKLRSTFGTARRIIRRNYWKPLRLEISREPSSDPHPMRNGEPGPRHAGPGLDAGETSGAEELRVLRSAPSLLVVIASYGTAQDRYLERLLSEYRTFKLPTRVVVLSNKIKPVQGAEVVAGLPSPSPYSLPFAHKKILAENVDRYDLFLYSEDDTLIKEQHIEAFLAVQSKLREDEIPGFVRSEINPEGHQFITSIHHHFRWLPESVVTRSGELFARLSNEHSGCFIATRKQLRRAMASGGFLVPPHAERYGMLETAASDIYTQCGLRRLICFSRIQDFIVPHLPNKYYGKMGISLEQLESQTRALSKAGTNGTWTGKLFEPASRAAGFRWSKDLYERPDEALLGSIPAATQSVLSVGCGWGENEAWLSRKGMNVCAVPLDTVFGASLRRRGIRTVVGPIETVIEGLGGERFDLVLLPDVLHLLEDPVAWLRRLRALLAPNGWLKASVANTGELGSWVMDWRAGLRRPLVADYEKQGVQPVSVGRLQKWCRAAGMEAVKIVPVVEGRRRALQIRGLTAIEPAFASKFILSARLSN